MLYILREVQVLFCFFCDCMIKTTVCSFPAGVLSKMNLKGLIGMYFCSKVQNLRFLLVF